MKTYWEIYIIAIMLLLAIRMVVYYKFIKIHKKQVEELEGLIIELKGKQIVLNHQLKIIQFSEKHQKQQYNIISYKIFETIHRYYK